MSVAFVDRERMHASLHALSQPLTVISLALTLVQSSSDAAEQAHALEAMEIECQRAVAVVKQLRSLLDRRPEPALHRDGGADTSEHEQNKWLFGGMA